MLPESDKRIWRCAAALLFALCVAIPAFAQQAADYFPASTGHKWYFKTTLLDTLSNPVDSLSTYRIDSFAVTTTFGGLNAKLLRSKTGAYQSVALQPYLDTNYVNTEGTDGKIYFRVANLNAFSGGQDTLLGNLSGFINFLRSLEKWYPVYKFANTVNLSYTIFSKDTTLTLDSTIGAMPLRFEFLGKRVADQSITNATGTYACKKFIRTFRLSYVLPFPLPAVPLLTIPDSIWLAQGKWEVQSHTPTATLDLTLVGRGKYFINGSKMVMVPQILPPTSAAETAPQSFGILQGYPNPFNPSATVEFTLPAAGEATIRVYNAAGEEVARLANDRFFSKGKHTLTFNAKGLPSGVYAVCLQGSTYSATIKLLLQK